MNSEMFGTFLLCVLDAHLLGAAGGRLWKAASGEGLILDLASRPALLVDVQQSVRCYASYMPIGHCCFSLSHYF